MKKHTKKYLLLSLALLGTGALGALFGCDKNPEPTPTPPDPSHTHSYSDIVTPPTCTERGYTTHKCECGDFYVDNNVPAKGHTEAEPVRENEVPNTCTSEGSYEAVVYCTDCEKELSREPVITEMHTFVDGVCSVCGTRDGVLMATGYTFDYTTSPATISRNVSNSIQSINLGTAFTVKKGAEWKLYSDADGKTEIEDKQLPLSLGHNYAYAIVEHGGETTKFLVDIYRLNTYTVTFMNGSTVISSRTVDEFTNQYALVNQTKEFYDFSHWAVNGERATFPHVVTGNVTFTAEFTPTPYEIEYELNGGEFKGDYPDSYDIETAVTLKSPELANYGFAGWYDNPALEGEPITVISKGNHGKVKFYAKWLASAFKINYELDGGEFKGDYPKSFTVETPTFSLASPVKADHSFTGWFTDPEFKNPISRVELGTSGDLTLYARWLFGTDGLELSESEDGEHFIITGYSGTARTVEIPEECYGVPVTEIGEGAFQGNTDITEVDLPESITRISDSAFAGCTSLTLSLPESLIYIGKSAFAGCTALTELTLNENLEFIGENAYRDCTGLTTLNFNSADCKTENVIFSGCVKLSEINIGEKLNKIPDYAFAACTALAEINIPANIETIGNYAFQGCTSLSEFEVPDTVSNIGLGVFSGCTNITKITLPFIGETGGTGVNGNFGYIFGAAAASNNSRFVPASLKTVVIKGGTAVGMNAFSGCSGIENIDLPETVTVIGNNAFDGCTSLLAIDVNTNVTTIGNYAYQNCTALTEVIIPDNVASLGINAFYGCTSLTDVKIGTGVSSIGSSTFWGCNSLTNVSIPDNVTSIGANAFQGCSSIVGIKIPETVTALGNYAFNGCSKLQSIIIPDSVKTVGASVFSGCSALADVKIGTGITSVTSSAFESCISLVNVVIPDNVTQIGGLAFSGCIALTDIKLSENLTSVGSNAFADCKKLNNVQLPTGLKTVGSNAFRGCETFTQITVPSTVTSIGTGAFNGCINLETLTLPFVGTADASRNNTNFGYIFGANNAANNAKNVPETLTSVIITDGTVIAASAFNGCANIVSITLPSTLTAIGDNAFNGCAALEEITLTENITEIGNSAFNNCVSLKKVIWNSENTTSATAGTSPIFAGCASLTELEIGANVTAIPDYAFRSCDKLETVTIGENVKTIGDEAFYDCESVETLTLPEGLTSIGAKAFYNCNKLNGIVIYDEVTSIGANAFDGCALMATVTIGEAVETIGELAFNDCASLTEITVPDSVTSMGASLFRGCIALEKLTVPFIGAGETETASSTSLFGYFFGTTTYGTAASQYYLAKQYYTGSAFTNYYIPSSLTELTVKRGNILFGAFDQCSKLQHIVMPDELPSIGAYSFRGCTSLQEINIPETVTAINTYAFANCSSVTEIYVPDSVNTIQNFVFTGCNKLVSMDLPFIGNNRTATSANNANVFGYVFGTSSYTGGYAASQTGTSAANYYIPTTLTTVKIRGGSVLKCAFQNCVRITNITLPDELVATALGDYAFYNCTALSTIKTASTADDTNVTFSLPSNIVTIGSYAFSKTVITEATIPDKVTLVNTYAFQTCTALTEVNFATDNALTSIGNLAFNGCTKLASVSFGTSANDANLTIGSQAFDGCTVLANTDTDGFTVPARVNTIGTYAFRNTGIIKLSIEKNSRLTTISDYAFYGLTKLTYLDFGSYDADETEPALTIGTQAFLGCTNAGFTRLNVISRITSIGLNAFQNCSGLTDLIIADGSKLATLNNYAFSGCTKLNNLDFGDTETALTIGTYVFQNCSALNTVTVPDNVTRIGLGAFSGCAGLTEMTLPFIGYQVAAATTNSNGYVLGYIFGTTNYTGSTATAQCYYSTSATSFYIPNSLTTVTITGGNVLQGAFDNCKFITSITLPAETANTAIGAYAFRNCAALADLKVAGNTTSAHYALPSTITSIGNYAFYGCTNENLANLDFISEVTSIGTYAFHSCTSLTNINIPKGVTTVSDYTFYGCNNASITSITINDNITSIGAYAFANFPYLTKITVPDSVNTIGLGAFSGCIALEEIDLPFIGSTKTAATAHNNYIFGYIFGTANYTGSTATAMYGTGSITYYLPTSLTKVVIRGGNILQGAFYNCKTLRSITLPNEVLSVYSIGTYAFRYCDGLEELKVTGVTANAPFTLPTNITTVGNYAFEGCTNAEFTTISFPESVTAIGSYAFQNCTALTNITLPAEITVINNYTFNGCTALGNVTIPDKVVTIGTYAFTGCSSENFNSITIPASVTSIGTNAFQNCRNVMTVTFTEPAEAPATFNLAIGATAFAGLELLENITLPDRTNTIANNVFMGCSSLKSISLPFVGNSRTATAANAIFGYIFGTTNYTNSTATNQYSSTNYYIPNDLTTVTVRSGNILQNAFLRCGHIETLILPNRLYSNTAIGDSSLRELTSLTTLKILGDNSSSPLSLPENTTAIGQYTLYTNPLLTSVKLPETLTSIGNYAFQNCTALNNVNIPVSVTSIGQYAFSGCSSLANLTFAEPAETTAYNLTVNAYAFQYCTALESVTLPDRTNTVANFVFMGCGSLKSMNLPFIGNNRTQTAANNANVFGYIFGTTKPAETLEEGEASKFVATAQTGTSAATYYIPAGLTSVTIRGGNILAGAFQNCAMLTSITLPENLNTQKAIGVNAFNGCTGITSITLPSDVTSLGNTAFNGCSSLTSITIPVSITSIGTNTFSGCEALTDVYCKGVEADFNVTLGTGNENFEEATKHFEAPAPDPEPDPDPEEGGEVME